MTDKMEVFASEAARILVALYYAIPWSVGILVILLLIWLTLFIREKFDEWYDKMEIIGRGVYRALDQWFRDTFGGD